MTETPDRTESIFAAALALAADTERAAYLKQACAGDAALLGHVEALLRAHERAGHMLDRPVPGGPELAGVPSEQPGVVIAGRYKLLEKINEGGMGAVWVAEQTEPVRRKVALKLIKAGMDSKTVLARFEAERQALAVMDHPNIAKVFDGGLTETGRPYFVMEYVKGVPITEYCDATRLSVPERLHLFVQVCHAVQHAHQKGIIHRDLKPSNILVAPYDDKPVPKVIDFGLAKAMHQSLTERTLHTAHETVLGTPLYMSPEQAQLNNLDVDTRSDIYSLGVLLYELLTGTTPVEKKRFKEAAWDEVRRIIREEEPPRPSTRLSSANTLPSLAAGRQTDPVGLTKLVRGELDWIVMKSLEKERARRYETATGLGMDIQRYLAGEPVLAAPPSASYRLRKFARKNRVALTTAATITLLVVAGVVAVVTVQVRANRDLAEKNAELAREQSKVEARNQELADEQAKVQARFELAQKAIATFHTGVTEDALLKNEQFKELRMKLLKEAAGFYADLEKLLAGQTDERSRKTLAAAYFQLGELTTNIGTKPEALAAHRKALALRRDLAAAARADVETRLDVVRSLGAIGRLSLATGDWAGSLHAYTEQHDVAAALEAESPTEPVRTVLAESYIGSARILRAMQKGPEALAANEKAVAILSKLAESNSASKELRAELARGLFHSGRLFLDYGKWPEALAAFDDARAISQRLVDTYPAVTRYRSSLSRTHRLIGFLLLDVGKHAEALRSFEQALAIAQKLADTQPADINVQNLLGWSHHGVGSALTEMRKPAMATASIEKALGIGQKIAEADPKDILVRELISASYYDMGEVYTQMGRPEQALRSHEQARAILGKSAEKARATLGKSAAPDGGFALRYELPHGLIKIGLLLSASGKSTEALTSCQKALAIHQKLCDAQPALASFRSGLADSYSALGTVQRRAGQPAKAVASLRRAIAMVEQLPTLTPRNLYTLACCHAQLVAIAADAGSGMTPAQASAEAERAMARLRQAIGAGYDNVGGLRSDASLDTLRQREDFQKLVKQLEAKAS